MLSSVDLLGHYRRALPGVGDRPLEALARAVAASPGWPTGCGAVLLAREGPPPALAVVGHFDEEGERWLRGQIQALHDACRHLRYVDHATFGADCQRLADALRSLLGPGGLAAARFTAIPRGGSNVLTLLASLLGLEQDQIEAPPLPDRPLIVVDDCALSGACFFRFLRTVEVRRVVFAPLYSHPELRAAIVRREPRVTACLSARDLAGQRLAETAAETGPEEKDGFYWAGHVEALCFPWNEPDRTFWNPAARRWELAWRIVPPELCCKNRPATGTAPKSIQIQPQGEGPLRPSARVLSAEIDGQVVLYDLEAVQALTLAGTGSDLWRAIIQHGDIAPAVVQLGRTYGAPEETLRADTLRFTQELLRRGLLEHATVAGPAFAL